MKRTARKILLGIEVLSLLVLLGACASQNRKDAKKPPAPIVAKSKAVYTMDTKEADEGAYDIIQTETPVVLGPGPRLTDLSTHRGMEFMNVEILDAKNNVVKTVELHAVDEERIKWQADWWMEESDFKDGAEYQVFSRGKDIYGLPMVAVKEGQSRVTLEDRSAGAQSEENDRSFVFRFRFSKTEPNPNLEEDWAKALVKKHAKR